MPVDEVDGATGLSEAPETLDTFEKIVAGVVAAPPEHAFTEGAQVGRYVLEQRLGAGAMGVVWAAYDPQLDRKVALKILRRSTTGAPGSVAAERAAREARALARLVHPNIVAVHDAGVEGEALYVVMELVEGVTLRAHLAAAPRSFDEIVELFVQAGVGLAAAHEAKLVHRDFKPDNVLVGRDGRVRVADFGLARIVGVADTPDDAPTPTTTPAPTALAGTLAYMAPEQMAPGPIDHRADQFAFAVSWWGALFEVNPFAGETIAARRAAIAAGPKPGARKVPAWLVAILRRALAADPDARFPSMRALLDAVARGRGRRRRIGTAAAAIVAVAAIVPAMWWSRTRAGAEPCTGGAAEIAAVLTPERSQAIGAAFPDHEAGRAAAQDARDRFAGYARDWAEGHGAACRATRVDHAQSEDLLDRRMVCLDRARARLDAVLAWIPKAGVAASEAVGAAIDALPDLDACGDLEALAAVVPQPTDPEARRRVEAATLRLDGLSAGLLDPSHPVRTTQTAQVLEEARAAGWAPLIAEALGVHGAALYAEGDLPASKAAYEEALRWSLEGGHDHHAARVMADLAWGAAQMLDAEDARSWLELARAMLRRIDESPELALRVTTTAVEVARQLGKPEDAVAEAKAALALAETTHVSADEIGRAHLNLALAESAAGRYERALAHGQRAIELAREEAGPEHPLVASRLDVLGVTQVSWGRFAEARETLANVLSIREAWFGPHSLELIGPLQTLGAIAQHLGEVDTARAHFERAMTIARAHPNANPAERAELEANLAVLEAMTGNYDVAVERGSAALASLESMYGTDAPRLITGLILVGYAERGRGNLDAAAAHQARAVAIGERGLGADHPEVANPRIELGVTEVARGRVREGIALFERVIATGAKDPNLPRRYVAEASLRLAEVLAKTDAKRARALATTARDLYEAEGMPGERDAAAAWLAAH